MRGWTAAYTSRCSGCRVFGGSPSAAWAPGDFGPAVTCTSARPNAPYPPAWPATGAATSRCTGTSTISPSNPRPACWAPSPSPAPSVKNAPWPAPWPPATPDPSPASAPPTAAARATSSTRAHGPSSSSGRIRLSAGAVAPVLREASGRSNGGEWNRNRRGQFTGTIREASAVQGDSCRAPGGTARRPAMNRSRISCGISLDFGLGASLGWLAYGPAVVEGKVPFAAGESDLHPFSFAAFASLPRFVNECSSPWGRISLDGRCL